MKIVINAYSARMGGGQTYLKHILAKMPVRADLEVLIFAPAALNLPLHPHIKRVQTRWPTTNPMARALWEHWALPSFLRRERADVLFCPGGVVGSRLPAGCKVVTMFRNMIPFDAALVSRMPWGLQRLRNVILRRVLLRSMANADLTIFISDHARGLIEQLAHIPNPVTIPHGISEAFRTVDRPLPRPEGAPHGRYLLYVSRFDIYKHHREILRAFTALPDEVRKDLSLVFLGETDMPEAEPVARLIQDLGIQDKVLMPGAVPYDSLPAWYQHANAILFASSCENCPNILLESMGSGRPVLSSNIMPMPEFGGKDIVYFSPFDPKDISQAMLKILGDKECAQRVAQAAMLRSARYDWKLTAQETWARIIDLGDK
ncbi:MAG: glycosyltransferase family 1 protein [Propionivibrio sp.]